jgi:hypothetical protein
MNLIDATVTKVHGTARFREVKDQSWWEIQVDYRDDGGNSKRPTTLQFSTEEAANAIKPGYVFQH